MKKLLAKQAILIEELLECSYELSTAIKQDDVGAIDYYGKLSVKAVDKLRDLHEDIIQEAS